MNTVSKQYIRNIKALFPIMGKSERDYLSKLKISLEDCCESGEPESLEILYKEFGTPEDVLHSYFNSMDTELIIKHIRFKKIVRFCLVCIVAVFLFWVVFNSAILYNEHQIFADQQAFFEETTIE